MSWLESGRTKLGVVARIPSALISQDIRLFVCLPDQAL